MHSKYRLVFILFSQKYIPQIHINNIRYKKDWIFSKGISKYCNWIEVSLLNIPKFPTYLKSSFHHMLSLCGIECTHAKTTLCLLFFLKCHFYWLSPMPVFYGANVLTLGILSLQLLGWLQPKAGAALQVLDVVEIRMQPSHSSLLGIWVLIALSLAPQLVSHWGRGWPAGSFRCSFPHKTPWRTLGGSTSFSNLWAGNLQQFLPPRLCPSESGRAVASSLLSLS